MDQLVPIWLSKATTNLHRRDSVHVYQQQLLSFAPKEQLIRGQVSGLMTLPGKEAFKENKHDDLEQFVGQYRLWLRVSLVAATRNEERSESTFGLPHLDLEISGNK